MLISDAFPPTRHAGPIANPGEAEQIARSLKARRVGNYWIARCPCHDDRTASLSIREGEDGRLLMKCHSASACKFEDVMNELIRLGHMGSNKLERARRLVPYVKPVPTEHTPDPRAAWLWNNSVPPQGTPVQTYLERRGIPIMPPSLRYCADPRAMIAGF
jgi:putative DNA primase/helicase